MRLLYTLCSISLFLLGSTSCTRPKGDDPGPCAGQEIGGVAAALSPCIAEPPQPGGRVYVINSLAEYQATFPCSSQLSLGIDFASKTLLVGYVQGISCDQAIRQRLLQTCATGGYTYELTLRSGVCAAANPVTSSFVVPKLASGASVAIQVIH